MITRNEFSAQLREQLEDSDAYPAWDEEVLWKKIVSTQAARRKGGFRFWVLLLSLPFLTILNADCSLQHTAPSLKHPEVMPQQPVANLNQAIEIEGLSNEVQTPNPGTIAHGEQQIQPIVLESTVPELPTLDSPLVAVLIDRNTCIKIETEWLVAYELKDRYHFLDLFRPTQDSTLSLPPEIKLKTF